MIHTKSILLSVLVSLLQNGCTSKRKSIRPLKLDIVYLATGADRVYTSKNGKFLAAEFYSPSPKFRILENAQDSEVFLEGDGWPLGAPDDAGKILYLQRVEDGNNRWQIKSSGHSHDPEASSVIAEFSTPLGARWVPRGRVQTQNYAVVVMVSEASREKNLVEIWAVSVDLRSHDVVAKKRLNANVGFDQGSLDASPLSDDIYLATRRSDSTVELVALNAKRLSRQWAVPLASTVHPPDRFPSTSVTVTGDGRYIFVASGERLRGVIASNSIYAVKASNGHVLFGPAPRSLAQIRLKDVLQVVPGGGSTVAILQVSNLRDEPDRFRAIRVIDLLRAEIVAEVNSGPTTHAIAVKPSGSVLVAPLR